MRLFHWLWTWFERLRPRERIVVAGGATISLAALILVFGVLPFGRRWSEREASLEAKAAQLARLEALLSSQQQLEGAVAVLEGEREGWARRLLSGRTPALAASTLQTLLRGYAERSRVTLDRINADREFEPGADGLTPIGMELVVRGDVFGLVDFLFYLQNGEKLLVIDELSINSSLRRRATDEEVLTWSVRLHGLYTPEEEPA